VGEANIAEVPRRYKRGDPLSVADCMKTPFMVPFGIAQGRLARRERNFHIVCCSARHRWGCADYDKVQRRWVLGNFARAIWTDQKLRTLYVKT